MKVNQLLTICGVAAALMLGAGTVSAQNDNGGNGGGGGGGFRDRGNFDPAQFQQRMMDNIRDQLGFTNDTDWNAVQPLVQKVMDARRDVGFGARNGPHVRPQPRRQGGGNGGPGGGRGGFLARHPARKPRPCKMRLMPTHLPRRSRTHWRNTRPRRRPNRPSWSRHRKTSARC